MFFLAAIVNDQHPLAQKKSVTLQELEKFCLVLPAIGMQGCIHTLKDAYQKPSAREFIQMLSQSTAILPNTTLADM